MVPPFVPLPDHAFGRLGEGVIAYVKPVMLAGSTAVGIFSPSGEQMATAPNIELAYAMIQMHDLEPQRVH